MTRACIGVKSARNCRMCYSKTNERATSPAGERVTVAWLESIYAQIDAARTKTEKKEIAKLHSVTLLKVREMRVRDHGVLTNGISQSPFLTPLLPTMYASQLWRCCTIDCLHYGFKGVLHCLRKALQ